MHARLLLLPLVSLREALPCHFCLALWNDLDSGELTRVRVVQSLTSFVEGVDAGQPGASLTIADVGDGVSILDWVHSGLIDSIFGDVKCTL
eukprot:COSAG06_NODE_42_length_29897_cov_42.547721_9_plen_91_part_00